MILAVVLMVAGPASAGEPDQVSELKAALDESPGDPVLTRRLGIAYFNAGNDFWAIRTLTGVLADNPGDCEARAWLALSYLRRAFPDEALAVARTGTCEGPALLRLRMVEALALKAAGQSETADRLLSDAMTLADGWTGDVAAAPAVRRRVNPEYVPEVSWSLETGGGYTSNAMTGAATDQAATGGDERSALMTVDARVRLAPDFGGPVRGVLEVQPRLQWFFADGPERLSFFEVTGQAGILIRSTLPRVLLAYRPDWLLLPNGFRGENGPVPYMEGHRGEFEIEILPELLVFGGAGTRKFREMVRTRTEVDLGIGGSASPVGKLSLLWAASGRYYDARHDAWDLAGASAMFAAVMRLPHDLSVRTSVTLSADWYYDSAATAEADPFRTVVDRTDFFVKLGAQFWTPSMSGVRFGASYDFSSRESTAELYSYTDHRILLRVRWTGSADFRRPRDAGLPADVGKVDWGDGGVGLDERVQDMLRQDEQVQRSSSCVN